MERLIQEIHRLDQDICSILSKNPRSNEDEQVLEYKRQRLARKEQELKEKEERKEQELKEERDYQRKVTEDKARLELTGALSVFLALECRYLICFLHSASCKTRYYGKLCPETR